MPVNDCFFDNFLAGADVATTTSISPAEADIAATYFLVVTVLVRVQFGSDVVRICYSVGNKVFAGNKQCLSSLSFSPKRHLGQG